MDNRLFGFLGRFLLMFVLMGFVYTINNTRSHDEMLRYLPIALGFASVMALVWMVKSSSSP